MRPGLRPGGELRGQAMSYAKGRAQEGRQYVEGKVDEAKEYAEQKIGEARDYAEHMARQKVGG